MGHLPVRVAIEASLAVGRSSPLPANVGDASPPIRHTDP
jgi:hypothetical protein